MKNITVFYISDNKLTLYGCQSKKVSVIDVYDLVDSTSVTRFSQQAFNFKKTRNYILFDVSYEDYHQEQLPHLHGRDRKLLIQRKLEKYFHAGEYAHAELIKRMETGRRDDLYSMSGIADSSSIDPVVDLISQNNIEISGVYSLPLLIGEMIRPVVHNKQVLVVSCDEPEKRRLNFRQSFIDHKHLYFSRQTTVLVNDAVNIADQFRKEVERTWHYLNNKRVVAADERMQVLMIIPSKLAELLKPEAGASHCDYIYADFASLHSQHDCHSETPEFGFATLATFLLAKTIERKTHYQPKKLSFYHKHQQINRLLLKACVVVVAITMVFLGSNIKSINDVKNRKNALIIKSTQSDKELAYQQSQFSYSGSPPKKMQDLVQLSQQIIVPEALPKHVFSVISQGFSGFSDLTLSDIDWQISSLESINNSFDNSSMDNNNPVMKVDDIEEDSQAVNGEIIPESLLMNRQSVIVNISGIVQVYDSNYRQAIERIELLASRLKADPSIETAVVTRLPLDIDPSIKTSRTLSSIVTPEFSVQMVLKRNHIDG